MACGCSLNVLMRRDVAVSGMRRTAENAVGVRRCLLELRWSAWWPFVHAPARHEVGLT